MSTPVSVTPSATVNVKSAWYSKVNWIAGIGSAVAVLNEMLPMLPAPYQHDATVAIVVLTGLGTIIAKTFYTTTITPSSATKA